MGSRCYGLNVHMSKFICGSHIVMVYGDVMVYVGGALGR